MLPIEWRRLPEVDGTVISEQETTGRSTAASARALLLWPTMRRDGSRSPDGFPIVDQDDVSMGPIPIQGIE